MALKKFVLDILFPRFCLGCGREGTLLCQDCFSTIEILEEQFCPFCKKPKKILNKGKCRIHQPMNLDGLFAATSYKNSLVKNLIRNFKYGPFLKGLRGPLASLIIAQFLLTKNKYPLKDKKKLLLVPIPLANFRKRWRGFNQSEELAKILSQFFKISLLNNGLIKIKKTQPQVELSVVEREKNIKDSFDLKNPQAVRGKIVYLIDDVFTTGATLEEAARVLKRAGAKEVWGIVVAREELMEKVPRS